MNKVVLIGRTTRDIELNKTSSGISFARFSLAVDGILSSKTNERKVDFIDCIVWRNIAENMEKYCKKGSLVAVEGRIQTGSFEKDGQKHYTTDIVADNITFLSTKGERKEESQTDAFQEVADTVELNDSEMPF